MAYVSAHRYLCLLYPDLIDKQYAGPYDLLILQKNRQRPPCEGMSVHLRGKLHGYGLLRDEQRDSNPLHLHVKQVQLAHRKRVVAIVAAIAGSQQWQAKLDTVRPSCAGDQKLVTVAPKYLCVNDGGEYISFR